MKNRPYIIFGTIFILFSLLSFFNAFYYNRIENIFWVCYTSLFIIGVGILIKNGSIVKSQLYILFIPDLIWTFDFITYFFLTEGSLLGISDYLFLEGPLLPKIVTLQHLFTIPLALFFSLKSIEERKNIWIMSYLQLVILYSLALLFTDPKLNINCVYKFCGNIEFSGVYYTIFWFVGSFLMIYLTKLFLGSISRMIKKKINE